MRHRYWTKWKFGRFSERTAVLPNNRSFTYTEYSHISAHELCETRDWEKRNFVDSE
jgi:hypothetical protein